MDEGGATRAENWRGREFFLSEGQWLRGGVGVVCQASLGENKFVGMEFL